MKTLHMAHTGLATALVMLGACSSGCMVSPQHGELIGDTDDIVAVYGATAHPGERLQIEARNDRGEWVRIGETRTESTPRYLESGTWYIYCHTWIRIRGSCWRDIGFGLAEAELRVRSLDYEVYGSPALFTFELGFDPLAYSDVAEMWIDYGHGRSVTVYGWR